MDSFMVWSVVLNFLIRWLVSRFSYSGARNSPIFGDYEAQRHWMEITYALDPTDWYKNTTDNDLEYWGLDYPPLTAYHSWLNGWVASKINTSWIELHKSRGFQSYDHKIFMRSTVIVTDLLVYFSAMIYFFMNLKKKLTARERAMSATIGLMYPALILVDHGHFQYNHMTLGFTLWAVNMMINKRYVLGSVFYCLALNYKQISLYYSFPFFFFLLGVCLKEPSRLKGLFNLILIAAAVIGTFFVCWFPFLTDRETILSVIKRLFPLSRGLYEDKVANIWCSLEVIIKLKQIFSPEKLAGGAAALIILLQSFASLHLLKNPTPKKFINAMVFSSLVFFLLAFQVHEKSILFAALPVILLIHDDPQIALWFYIVSTFSLHPLMVKDGLVMPAIALTFFSLIIYVAFFNEMGLSKSFEFSLKSIAFNSSVIGCLFLTVISMAVEPPARYPHIFVLLNAIYSCIHFVAFAVYFHIRLFREEPYYRPLKEKPL